MIQTQNLNRLINQINEQFNTVLASLNITTPSGLPVDIHLYIETNTLAEFDAYAERIDKNRAIYEIRVNTGFSRQLWIAALKELSPELNFLSWVEQCKIQNVHDERLIKLSKKELLAAFACCISIWCVILHEFAHIVLGHCDYIKDEMKLNHFSVLQDEKQLSSEQIEIKRAFEAEADRQAGQWLVGIFEQSLTKNGSWGYLSFPSRLNCYEFFIYAIAILFRVIQDLTPRNGDSSEINDELIHPNPNERLYVLIASLEKYFSQNLPNEQNKIYTHVVESAFKVGKKLNLIDSYNPLTVIQNAYNLAFVDDVVRKLNLSHYQHKVEVVESM